MCRVSVSSENTSSSLQKPLLPLYDAAVIIEWLMSYEVTWRVKVRTASFSLNFIIFFFSVKFCGTFNRVRIQGFRHCSYFVLKNPMCDIGFKCGWQRKFHCSSLCKQITPEHSVTIWQLRTMPVFRNMFNSKA